MSPPLSMIRTAFSGANASPQRDKGTGKCLRWSVRPHVITHRPADDFAGEEIEHDGQIEPPFLGWHEGDVGEPNLIGPLGGDGRRWCIRGTAAALRPLCLGGA
jgi:hypothetical protein